jgi:5-hydroxyisourate hydrolase
MGRLTTHVLDTANGSPAAGVRIDLVVLSAESETTLVTVRTNADGRCDSALLEGDAFAAGLYELRFHVGDYFRGKGENLPAPPFLDVVPVRFGIASADQHYHVPLLISPYGYSTYRGS